MQRKLNISLFPPFFNDSTERANTSKRPRTRTFRCELITKHLSQIRTDSPHISNPENSRVKTGTEMHLCNPFDLWCQKTIFKHHPHYSTNARTLKTHNTNDPNRKSSENFQVFSSNFSAGVAMAPTRVDTTNRNVGEILCHCLSSGCWNCWNCWN